MFSGLHREEGQGLAEYALILGFIATVVVVALTFLGQNLLTSLTSIADNFSHLLGG